MVTTELKSVGNRAVQINFSIIILKYFSLEFGKALNFASGIYNVAL